MNLHPSRCLLKLLRLRLQRESPHDDETLYSRVKAPLSKFKWMSSKLFNRIKNNQDVLRPTWVHPRPVVNATHHDKSTHDVSVQIAIIKALLYAKRPTAFTLVHARITLKASAVHVTWPATTLKRSKKKRMNFSSGKQVRRRARLTRSKFKDNLKSEQYRARRFSVNVTFNNQGVSSALSQ